MTLYYQPEQMRCRISVDTAGSGEEVWAKVTVAPQSGGGFQLRSNQLCDRPERSAVLPPPDRRGAGLFQHAVFQQCRPPTNPAGVQHTLHNQFLTCLYAGPQDINLFDLFYNGVGTWDAPSQAELEQLGVLAADGSQICPTV